MIAQIYLQSSYHHVLKFMWLDRKQNWHVDHLIYTLVVNLLPYHETCHNSQELRFSSSNLAQKCQKELLARTLEMNANSIHSVEDDHYYVQSATEPSHTYLVVMKRPPFSFYFTLP